MSRPQEAPAVLPPSPPSTPIRGVPIPSPPSLPRPKSCSPPQSPPPEVMTQQDWEEVWEIEYQWAQERYKIFQKKLQDVLGDRKTYELSDEEHKKLEEIIDNDIDYKY